MTNASNFRDDLRRGELYWRDWSPGRGSEQTGLRPALVIQADAGNANPRYNLIIVATVSKKGKSTIPTHVELAASPENGLRDHRPASVGKQAVPAKVALTRPLQPRTEGEHYGKECR
ncbi:MAG: type II toxin-antitoxin system PemK/MazF family toxin [Armatimonadota bacterium]|nr:type II toxin-antitoxin system PemK/MazF family toxin [Armatimonadota bacterium]